MAELHMDEKQSLNFSKKEPNYTTQSLLDWGKSLLSMKEVDIENATDYEKTTNQRLGLIGLQSAKQVIEFLKSSDGQKVRTEILEAITLEEKKHINQIEQSIEERQQSRRLMAFFMSLMLAEETDAKEYVKTIVSKQQKQSIAQEQKILQNSALSSGHLQQKLSYNKAALAQVVKHINDNRAEYDELQQKGILLNIKGEEMNTKYVQYDETISEFEKSIVGDQLSHGSLANKIKGTAQEMEMAWQTLQEKVDKGEDATLYKQKYNSLYTKFGILNDMYDVQKGDKYYIKANGDETNSFKEADFVLRKEQAIIEKNGTCYLVKKGQTWDDIKDSPEAQNKANSAYIKAKSELQSVKSLVQNNKELEKEFHEKQVNTHTKKLSSNERELRELINQKNLLESSKMILQKKIVEGGLSMSGPKPTFSSSNSSKKNSEISMLQSKISQLEKMNGNQAVTADQLIVLVMNAKGVNPKSLESIKADIQSQMQNGNIVKRAPIPMQAMQFLLKNMARLGIDPTIPGSKPELDNNLKVEEKQDSNGLTAMKGFGEI
jgi:hypothetical protein